MIEGIGIDLLEISRIKKLYQHNKAFPKRILTEKEYDYWLTLSDHRQMEFLAGRFAAKEAFSKAYGTGIGEELSFLDMEILPNKKNKPIFTSLKYQGAIHLSISHTENYAVAQVLLEKKKSYKDKKD